MSVAQPEPPREAGTLRSAVEAVLHELEHSDMEDKDVVWCARTLREALKGEAPSPQSSALLDALVKVRAHTSYCNPTPELLEGLLASIQRITDAALAGEERTPSGDPRPPAPDTPMLHAPGFLCPECGPHVPVDEFLCCRGCGCDTNGRYLVEQAQRLAALESRCRSWEREANVAMERAEAAEAKVKELTDKLRSRQLEVQHPCDGAVP